MDSRDGAIAAWEDGPAAFERALKRVWMERNAEDIQDEAAQQNFHARMHTSSSRSKHLMNLNWMLEKRQFLLFLQEMDLEVQEAMLVEE
jgi:hypothetical protein